MSDILIALIIPANIFLILVLINIFMKNAKDGVSSRNLQVKSKLDQIIKRRVSALNKKNDNSSMERARILNEFTAIIKKQA